MRMARLRMARLAAGLLALAALVARRYAPDPAAQAPLPAPADALE